ncbi:hypothetical protein BH11PLA2_BH11PLA2_41840 [soil metagenome]
MRNNLAIASSLFVGGILGGGIAEMLSRSATPVYADAPPLPAPNRGADLPGDPPAFDTIVIKLTSSVVAVDAIKPQTAPNSKSKSQEESGSGVIVKFDSLPGTFIITNNHVIAGAKAEEVSITLSDGRVIRPVKVLADPESDIALLNVDAPNLNPAPLADSDRVRVGQWVLAFGSPFGLNQTVTHGIISAKNRGQISLGSTIRIKEFLQTDAAINPGSSGGPLVDQLGRVVGINTAIASNNGNNSGVAFSIPINLVKRIGKELVEKGVVHRGYLGVQLAPTLEPAEALRLGLDKVRGALVDGVYPGSPAATAGLTKGDVILQMESVDLRDENHLINLISNLPVNHKVKLGVWRSKALVSLEVTIGEWTATAKK